MFSIGEDIIYTKKKQPNWMDTYFLLKSVKKIYLKYRYDYVTRNTHQNIAQLRFFFLISL